MKVIISETVRKLRNDPKAANALREFIATGKVNDSRTITFKDQNRQRKVQLRIIPAQG
ncbi:hypothetical protein CURE108131_01175 [Cupriavidus respiraculi]|jgi:hypothetical protein|uniref:Uncharacterized protein n=1 Tax=Cupriavidus respiraculi TaxID=195930 RepID=A0ABM8WDT7_9BURK|nr:hypothetical protein [Cupriavidus respiraculi]MBY4949712.1 hypothetical protein [Cupriavidus respiraculi]CAG9165492.1 hypothetical protein LMG21510_00107 [Cupriavidus respiraculi]